MEKYTEDQIKKFAEKAYRFAGPSDSKTFAVAGFIAGFKKAMELLQPPATKPLSEITDEDFIAVAKYMGLTEGDFEIERRPSDVHLSAYSQESTLFFEDGSIYFNDFESDCSNTGRDYLDAYDFLRSKGYILPTQK